MSDSSSDEEDLSKFKEAVDNSFSNITCKPSDDIIFKVPADQKSERYLEISGHYNDVKVPAEMQKKIGAKLSSVIQKNIEFVDVDKVAKKRKIKGGVKLFKNSEGFLSCEEKKDLLTENHNIEAKILKGKSRCDDAVTEEKINSVAVTGDFVLSKEETKMWKSRRKEKLFKYRRNGKSKVLSAIDD